MSRPRNTNVGLRSTPRQASIEDLLIAVATPDACEDSPAREAAWNEIKRRAVEGTTFARILHDVLLAAPPEVQKAGLERIALEVPHV